MENSYIVDLWLFLYITTVLCMAGLVWAVWEFIEAKRNGQQWMDLNRELMQRLDRLERKDKNERRTTIR